MRTVQEIFRDLYAESKKPTANLKYMDAVDKFEKKIGAKAPFKNLSSFKSSVSQKNKS